MTAMEHNLLQRLNNDLIEDWRELPDVEQSVLREMHRKGWLSRLDKAGYAWLSDAGKAALQAENERLDREAQKSAEDDAAKRAERAYLDQQTKKQFRHDWRIAFFEVLGGFLLGLIVDHLFDVIGYASCLWSALFH